MIYRGRELNPRTLWEALGVSIPANDTGTFSSLLHCPHPEHDNKRSPAFQVNLLKPLCNCFGSGCFGSPGQPGTYEYAVQAIKGCTEREARRFILKHTGMAISGDVFPADGVRRRKSSGELQELARDLERLARGEFTFLPKEARAYLDHRGIGQTARGKWEIGWDEDGGGDPLLADRIVIPARDHRGAVRFLIRRAIDGRQPKYVYSRGSVKTDVLFGFLHVPRSQRILTLVEGSVDSIHLHELRGDVGAAGTLGSGLSERQVRLIHERRFDRIYTMFDRDESGVSNTIDACNKLSRFPVFVCTYPKGVDDPAETSAADVERMVTRALPRHEFLARVRRQMTTKRRERRREYV